MLERRRRLEEKQKARDWERLSKKQKNAILEKQNREKFEVGFKKNADKMRTKVKEQYEMLKTENESDESDGEFKFYKQ